MRQVLLAAASHWGSVETDFMFAECDEDSYDMAKPRPTYQLNPERKLLDHVPHKLCIANTEQPPHLLRDRLLQREYAMKGHTLLLRRRVVRNRL